MGFGRHQWDGVGCGGVEWGAVGRGQDTEHKGLYSTGCVERGRHNEDVSDHYIHHSELTHPHQASRTQSSRIHCYACCNLKHHFWALLLGIALLPSPPQHPPSRWGGVGWGGVGGGGVGWGGVGCNCTAKQKKTQDLKSRVRGS